MKINRNTVWFILAVVLLAACGKTSYRKTVGGMPYKIYKGNGKKRINNGNVVKYHVKYILKRADKDTTYFDTYNLLPIYATVRNTPINYDISEVWTKMSVGDSVVATQMIDTFLLRDPNMAASGKFTKGEKLISYIKILDVFENDSLKAVDEQNEYKKYLANEITYLEKYLADKNIKTIKTPSGAFVEIINAGTGNPIDSGKYVSVNYTGTSISGRKFDSTTDSAFQHVQPLSFVTGARGGMIKGFDEGVQMMSPGGRANVYVPSLLGYGGSPDPRSGIRPFEHIFFDITVVDVKDKAPETQRSAPININPGQPQN